MKQLIRKSSREGIGGADKGKQHEEFISGSGQPRATTQCCPYKEPALLQLLPPFHGKPRGLALRKAKKNSSLCQAMKQLKDFQGSRVAFGHGTWIWLILILFSLFLFSNVDASTRLMVVIQPQEVAADARWRLDNEEAWRLSGAILVGLSEGVHTVEFLDMAGWTKPNDRATVLKEGRTTLVTGIYMMEGGSLQVTISPREAIEGGAMWRRTGMDTWRGSGETETAIPPGEFQVEFKEATGFTTPPARVVTIVEGEKTALNVSYAAAEPALQVTIYPPDVAAQGARWKVDGGDWHESGYLLKGLSLGDHTVEFKAVPGWITPPNQVVTILPGQTTQTSGNYIPSSTLCVTLAPEEVVDAGARWRVDRGAWLPSGWCIPLPPGMHLVEFRDVEHWTKPSSQLLPLVGEQTIHVAGTYLFSSGCLEVSIEPEEAVTKGARWRADGGSWFDSGQSVFLSVGEHTVEFCDVFGWAKPTGRKVTVPPGECIHVVETYAPAPLSGSLRVTIAPPEAVAAGAQWRRLGTNIWRSSGEVEVVPSGTKTVDFKPLSTWTTPPKQDVFVPPGQLAEITGVYGLPGSLCVTIIPSEAIAAGARWRVDGGPWHESGDVATGLSVGLHTVSFNTVSGWAKPSNRTVTIGKDTTQNVTSLYRQQSGSLRVTIAPPEAVTAGAKWRRVGSEQWRDSGTIESGIPAGSHTVEFSDVLGWAKPANRTLTINTGRTTSITETYSKKTGSLRVTIDPSEAVAAGAKWRRMGTSLWRDSGTTESGIFVGQYEVEFRAIGGWTTPANQTVTIEEDQRAETTGAYAPASGSLQVFITPQEVIDGGAKWRVDGGSWQDSSTKLEGLPTGYHSVSFSTVTGWTKPSNKTVTITNGGRTTFTGIYIRTKP